MAILQLCLYLIFLISYQHPIYAAENIENETLYTIVSDTSSAHSFEHFLNRFFIASLEPNAYQDVQKLNENLKNELELLINSIIELPSVIDYSEHKKDLINYFDNIRAMYKVALNKRKLKSKIFSEKIDEEALDNSLSGIYRILANQDTMKFLTENFKEKNKVFLNACRTKMSHIQMLDSLLAHTQIAIAQYYTTKYLLSHRSSPNRLLAKIQHYNIIAKIFREIMTTSPREFWTCSSQPATKLMNLERDYYFVQNRAMSNFFYNKVVTGARLVVEGSFIFIQVQEAKVLQNGIIDSSTLRWVPLNKDSLLGYIMHGKHTLESVDLTEITNVPSGSVITGLQFSKNGFTKRIKLVAYSREYNHTTGVVNKMQESSSAPSDVTDEYVFEDADDGTVAAPEKDLPISKSNQYVSFRVVHHKDKTQNRVPFIDTQKVESQRPTPLSGVGLYLKGQPDHEPSLSLKLYTLNIATFVNY